MKIRDFGIILLLLFWINQLYAVDLENWLENNKSIDGISEEILESFPYADYMKENSLTDIKTLEKDRIIFNNYKLEGDQFIISLFELYMNSEIIEHNDISGMEERIKLAETLSFSDNFLGDSTMVYGLVSDVLFSVAADSMQSWIYEKKVDENDFEIKFLIKKLMDNKFMINFSPNNIDKIIKYAKEGRWGYIFDKLTTTYIKEFIVLIISFLIFVSFFSFLFLHWNKKRKILKLNY